MSGFGTGGFSQLHFPFCEQHVMYFSLKAIVWAAWC